MAVSLTSSGLAMPATQSASGDANTFDDYEEGSWTPNILGHTGTAGTWGNIGREADYIKTGSMVYISFYAYVNNVGSYSGNLRVTGLPFTNTGILSSILAILISSSDIKPHPFATSRIFSSSTF